MGKFDGFLLVSDFDGTLGHTEYKITAEGKTPIKIVSKENCDAIRYFQSEGGLFTLASGRQPHYIAQWRDSFVPNTFISALNGAYLYDAEDGRVLFSRSLDDDFFEVSQRIFAECPAMKSVRFTRIANSIVMNNREPVEVPLDEPIYKMVFITPPETTDEYTARIPTLLDDRYLCMRSWRTGIEVQMRGSDKGDSIARLKEALGERARIAVAVGDYENDVDMIRAADIGYAVANAVPAALAAADRVTVSASQAAIARIIEELEHLR